LLSNIYLDPLDHMMAGRGFEMVRYADDLVILCQTAEEAAEALHLVQEWTDGNGLTLHPDKTKIVDVREESFDFLGYSFGPPYGRWPRKKSLQKLKDAIRWKTRRANGHSLKEIIKSVNLTLLGWFEYFKHAKWYIFDRLDQWIRMRLRSILRKRVHKRGRGRGCDNVRWTTPTSPSEGCSPY
jgi:RNA-directed DNA polymerase